MARTALKGIVKTSFESGFEFGFESGEAKGRIIGEAKGKAKGEAKRNTEFVRNLKQMGFKTADIVRATGLTEKEIDKLG